MPDIKSILTDEIRRLARKELRIAMQPLTAALADQKKRIAELEKLVKKLTAAEEQNELKNTCKPLIPEEDLPEKTIRLTPELILKIRLRLQLSQADMAKLIGVTAVSICQWELGKSHPRLAQKKQLAAIRDMGKRELAKLMAERFAAVSSAPKSVAESERVSHPQSE